MDNNNNNDSILNIVLIIFIIIVIWLFFNRRENFSNSNTKKINSTDTEMPMPMQISIPEKTNNKKYSNDLLGLDDVTMEQYMKDYYPTYAHQLECPESCGLSPSNYKCVQNADPIKMNLEAMTAANNKGCVTCTENNNCKYGNLPLDTIQQDQERLNSKKVSFDNVNSYVDFSNVTFQDSLTGPTQVDKLAVFRTGDGDSCDLDKYGTKISQVYDGLIGTSYKQKEKITQPLTGFYNGNTEGNIYAQPLTNITN